MSDDTNTTVIKVSELTMTSAEFDAMLQENAPKTLAIPMTPKAYDDFTALAKQLGHDPERLAATLLTDFLDLTKGPTPPQTHLSWQEKSVSIIVKRTYASGNSREVTIDKDHPLWCMAYEELSDNIAQWDSIVTESPVFDSLFSGQEGVVLRGPQV